MSNIIEGKLNAAGKKFAIIVSRFNDLISQKLLDGAIDCLSRHQADPQSIDIYKTPGAFEIPIIADKIASLKRYNAIICLGAIIRGDTPHFDYIASETTKGIASVGLKHLIPISFGILTTDNLEQAVQRAGAKSGNKGWDAALSAIEVSNLFELI